MISCLCFVALLLCVLLIMDFENENEYEVVYVNQLREMKNDSRIDAINTLIKSTHDNLYSDIMDKSTIGENKHSFTLMCKVAGESTTRLTYDGYKEWTNVYPQHTIALQAYNIEPTILRSQILHKIKKTFPCSSITTAFVRCCHVHTILW